MKNDLHKELLDLRDMFKKLAEEHENRKVDTNSQRQYHDGKAMAYYNSYDAIKYILENFF